MGPAELELPIEVAYLSNFMNEISLDEVCMSARAVVKFDRQGVKSTLIESSRSISNVTVSDDDLRAIPKLVAAAVLAELMRWIDNCSFRRKARRWARKCAT